MSKTKNQTQAQEDAEDRRRGELIVALLSLKESDEDKDSQGRRYDPPRYDTTHGTKTAKGLYLTVAGLFDGSVQP